MSLSGVKSSANRAARPRRAAVQGWPSARLDMGRAFRRARHAAEGDARLGDRAVLDGDVERAADGRDVLVEALRQLVERSRSGWRGRTRPRRIRRARGPACRSRGRSPPAAVRAACRPCADAASRPARSARAGCRRWASRWRCCRPPSRRCAPAPSRSGGSSRRSGMVRSAMNSPSSVRVVIAPMRIVSLIVDNTLQVGALVQERDGARSRSPFVTQSPTSVAPAISVASGCASYQAASASAEVGRRRGWRPSVRISER
jgi:hypothetical protein